MKTEWTAEEILKAFEDHATGMAAYWEDSREGTPDMAQLAALAAHLAKCTKLYVAWEAKREEAEALRPMRKSAHDWLVLTELCRRFDDVYATGYADSLGELGEAIDDE